MELLEYHHATAAVTIARVLLGLLFFFQGYDVIFRIGMGKATQTYKDGFQNKGIPHFLIVFAAWFTAWTELVCGALLIAGLFEYAALYLLGINLLIAAAGFGIVTPLWDMRHAFPRLALLLLLLLVPVEWHHWTLDHLLFHC